MIKERESDERGHADHGWLDTIHTLGLADRHGPARVDFGALRVLNEDRWQPGRRFGAHPHHPMEILTFMIEG